VNRRAKGILYGAILGAGIGLLRSAFSDPVADGLYVPQTTPGWIVNHMSFSLPFAIAGALIGIAVSGKQAATTPDATAEKVEAAIPLRPETTAVQRLGHVLGWTGTAIAIPLVALGFYGFTQEGGDSFIKGATIVIGALAFLIGRALRYVFAGPAR
jgi:hypothetical protein